MELNKTKLVAGIFIALSLVLSGAYYYENQEDIYYCEARDLVGFCDKLSSGVGSRCYFNETYKTCSEGWKEIKGFIEPEANLVEQVKVFANGEWYGCEIVNGVVDSYSSCVSKSEKFAYMGEII